MERDLLNGNAGGKGPRRFMNRSAQIALSILISSLVPLASAQQADSLQQQLDQLKLQYEQTAQQLQQTTQQMQQKIAALEQQIQQQREEAAKEKEQKEKEKQNTVSATELSAEQEAKKIIAGESTQVGANFQGKVVSEPSYDQLQEAETEIKGLRREMGTFEFHGYLRSGYGLNSEGGQQVAFEAPGAGDKYRLGNEAETYGEFIFVNNWLNPSDNGKGWLKTEVMFEANTTNSTNYPNFPLTVTNGVVNWDGNDQFRLREAFVRGGHIFGDAQTGAIFWAGERYYRRFHIEINDFYPLDLSGYGGGFEDLRLGPVKAAVAFLAGARPDITTPNGNYAKSNIDVRFYDFKTRAGIWAGWFDFATSKGGTEPNGTVIPTSSGEAFGLRHQLLEWHGGFHSFSVFYGTGPASNFSNPGSGTVIENPSPFINSQAQLLVTESLLFQPNDKFAIYPIFIFQRKKDGFPGHPWQQWVSFGARPEVFLSKYISLAVEAGFDHTSNQVAPTTYDGWLRKFTICPQIGAGRKFFSRPVLRAFLTYGNWSDDFRGLVGGIPFQNRTEGFTYGVQAETWW
jgi:maltoporin